jgi:hypothetical protein
MKKLGIVTVAFNNAKLLTYQIKTIIKYCKDNYEFVVFDNSTNLKESQKIENICIEYNITIIGNKHNLKNSFNPSESHGLALNYSYNKLKNKFDFLMFVDHELFPIKEFSALEIIGENIFAEVEQIRLNTRYFWPGLLILGKINKEIDFTPIPSLDTGGRLHSIINENFDKALRIKCKCVQIDLPPFTKKRKWYKFWLAKINVQKIDCEFDDFHDGTFMHFRKASNWSGENTEIFNMRENYLFC